MKKKLLALFAALALVLCTALPAFAAEYKYVYDDAGLLTESEAAALEQTLAAYAADETMPFTMSFLTTKDNGGKDARNYADDFYDARRELLGKGPDSNGALLLIDMDGGEVYISTSGDAIDYLNDARWNAIMDNFWDDLVDGHYAAVCDIFVRDCVAYARTGVPDDQFRYDESTGEVTSGSAPPGWTPPSSHTPAGFSWDALLVNAVIGIVIGGIAMLIAGSRYRVRTQIAPDGSEVPLAPSFYPLAEKAVVRLSVERDTLISSHTTSRHIPPPQPSSGSFGGGSATHTSSGGFSHGGGGRHF